LDELARKIAELIKGGLWYEAMKLAGQSGFRKEDVYAVAEAFKVFIPAGVRVMAEAEQEVTEKNLEAVQISITGARDFAALLAQIKSIPAGDRSYDGWTKLWTVRNPTKYLDIPVVRARYSDLVAQLELPLE
jgi:hypothetical protein